MEVKSDDIQCFVAYQSFLLFCSYNVCFYIQINQINNMEKKNTNLVDILNVLYLSNWDRNKSRLNFSI